MLVRHSTGFDTRMHRTVRVPVQLRNGRGCDDHRSAVVGKSRVFEQTFVGGPAACDGACRAGRGACLRIGGRMQSRGRSHGAGAGSRFDARASGHSRRILGSGACRREGAGVRYVGRFARTGRTRRTAAAGHAYRRLSRASGLPLVSHGSRRTFFASSLHRRAWGLPQAIAHRLSS